VYCAFPSSFFFQFEKGGAMGLAAMRAKECSRTMRFPESKLLSLDQMVAERQRLKQDGRELVFTNGCFDILHAGHVDYLAFARRQGDALVIGLNSDASVRRLKGPKRPINNEHDRAILLASLEAVDYVVLFEQDEPATIIQQILPDVLVKGADWAHYVSGREAVERNGGRVILAHMVDNHSTTGMISHIMDLERKLA
jgi:rfaE bifunctional protein nucleotidyltransferase chain/domain